jgi:hypothetical protein
MEVVMKRLLLIAGVAIQVACADKLPTAPAASNSVSGESALAARHGRPAPRVVAPRQSDLVIRLAGRYTLTTTRWCAGVAEPLVVGPQTVYLTQTGNQINFLLGVDTGGVQGTIHGNTIDLMWQQGVILCPVQLTGTAGFTGHSINGLVSGNVTSPGCDCSGSTLSITFGMERQ